MTHDSTTATKADIERLAKAMETGFRTIDARFDSVDEHLELILGHVCKHAVRIKTLEEYAGIGMAP